MPISQVNDDGLFISYMGIIPYIGRNLRNMGKGGKSFNSFTAKFKIVVWDYFLIQYYTYFVKGKNIINQQYL